MFTLPPFIPFYVLEFSPGFCTYCRSPFMHSLNDALPHLSDASQIYDFFMSTGSIANWIFFLKMWCVHTGMILSQDG